MDRCDDLSGMKFGYWKVVERAANNSQGSAMWACECECGNRRILRAQVLRNGRSLSCGCHKNDYNKRHGGKGSRLYEIWRQMRYRCDNQNNHAYNDYGGRGIKVCSEWYDFAKFRDWAYSAGYSDDLSIDRIDVNGNYEPSNCRWATSKIQMNNRRNTAHYEYNGELKTLSEWSRELGIPRTTLINRMKKGRTFEEAIRNEG